MTEDNLILSTWKKQSHGDFDQPNAMHSHIGSTQTLDFIQT